MSGLAAAGKAASSLGEGVAAREDNCGSDPLLWAIALEMGAAAGCVSGTACVVVLGLTVDNCWGAGVELCADTGCDDGTGCAGGWGGPGA